MALWLNEGWWIKDNRGRTGWVESVNGDRALVWFPKSNLRKWVNKGEFEIHEHSLPGAEKEIKELIDLALDAKDRDWFMELSMKLKTTKR